MGRKDKQLTPTDAVPLRAALRAAGLRATLPRLAVLWALRGAGAPVSHNDVAAQLAAQGLDRATVYRNLLDLARAGLAHRTDLGDHVWRFEAVLQTAAKASAKKAGASEEHPHFLCNQCGTVECLDDLTVQLGRSGRAPRALRRNDVEILVKGRCDSCA